MVWRGRAQLYNQDFIVSTTSLVERSVCIWGGICFSGRTDLMVLMNASMTSGRDRDLVVEPIILPLAGVINEGVVLIDDNACPHCTRIVKEHRTL